MGARRLAAQRPQIKKNKLIKENPFRPKPLPPPFLSPLIDKTQHNSEANEKKTRNNEAHKTTEALFGGRHAHFARTRPLRPSPTRRGTTPFTFVLAPSLRLFIASPSNRSSRFRTCIVEMNLERLRLNSWSSFLFAISSSLLVDLQRRAARRPPNQLPRMVFPLWFPLTLHFSNSSSSSSSSSFSSSSATVSQSTTNQSRPFDDWAAESHASPPPEPRPRPLLLRRRRRRRRRRLNSRLPLVTLRPPFVIVDDANHHSKRVL